MCKPHIVTQDDVFAVLNKTLVIASDTDSRKVLTYNAFTQDLSVFEEGIELGRYKLIDRDEAIKLYNELFAGECCGDEGGCACKQGVGEGGSEQKGHKCACGDSKES